MMGKTHVTAGIALASGTLILTNQQDPVIALVGIGFASFGALMPDIDHVNSTVSHKNLIFGALSRFCAGISSHRRFWHTPIASIGFTAIMFMLLTLLNGTVVNWIMNLVGLKINIGQYIIPSCFYFFVGCISHIMADTFNPEGAPWLWPIMPLDRKIHIPIISVTTGTIFETVYKAVFCVLSAVFIYYYVTHTLGFIPDFIPDLFHKMIGG